jgi:hypothetical protein
MYQVQIPDRWIDLTQPYTTDIREGHETQLVPEMREWIRNHLDEQVTPNWTRHNMIMIDMFPEFGKYCALFNDENLALMFKLTFSV